MAEDTSRLTTSDYLSVHAGCKAANSPDSQLQVVGYFLMDTEGCLISQVVAEGREEMEEMQEIKRRKGMSGASQPSLPTKESMCNQKSSVCLSVFWDDFFFPYLPEQK